jgi:hypothetical protein
LIQIIAPACQQIEACLTRIRRDDMTANEAAYLGLVITASVVFVVVLAWVSWWSKR